MAHQYTKVQREMFTLEDTLLGYIADDLSWCGDAGSHGEDLVHLGSPGDVQGAGALSSARDHGRSVWRKEPQVPSLMASIPLMTTQAHVKQPSVDQLMFSRKIDFRV